MKPLTNYQTINDESGRPAFVVIPYADFVRSQGYVPQDGVPHAVVSKAIDGMIPNEVVGKRIMNEVTMLQAWREYLMLTQEEMANRMGISQAGYAQIEAARRPRKATLEKAATALGITLEQLAY